MELEAKVIAALPLESGTSKAGKQWSKASIIVETPGQYPKKVKLSNMKNAEAFLQLAPGSVYIFHVEVESREWTSQTTGKSSWFTEVNAWKWEAPQAAGTPPASDVPYSPYTGAPVTAAPAQKPSATTDPAALGQESTDDDLPF